MSGCHGNSITGLLGALCDCSISGLSWKRRALGSASRESARRTLRKRAYGALLAGLFQDGLPKPPPNALANTPAHNKILMISFDLRVSGRDEEAERLEELLGQLRNGAGLSELDSVLELLVQLAGSVAPPPLSFSRDYMRRERPVQRRPPLGGYLSQDMQRLEERAWSLICGEEWGVFGGICRTVSIMDAPPGTGLLGLGRRPDVEEKFERETRLSLFGALQHSRTADMDIRLDLPPVPSNADITGLSIRVPAGLDQSDDEGFQSSSNLTPDSQSEPSPSPEFDVWEALRTFVPGRRRCWENIGCPPGQKEPPYLTEAGREAFDQLYRLWEGEMRNILSTQTPSPLLPLPLDCQSQLVKDVLNVLIGVSSATFPLNEASVQFDVRPDICVSGTSPESVSRLLCELAQYGTHYLRLSRFALSSGSQKGLVFQAFTGGLRRYLHYYRACVLSTPASLSLLIIACHFRKLGRQLRYLSELCCVDGIAGVGRATFPMGVKLLSCLYNEAQSNCSNENHPVLLSLLKSSCEPYTRFVSDWVYSGVFRDVYKEFMIEVNEDYLTYRDKNFWTQGYTLISRDAEDCVPVFLKHIANDVYVCGKTINLLKICCPQHYIFWSDVPVPRIAVTFSLQEVEEIERDCAVYRGRMETIARHSAISREEQATRTEQARQELINQVRETAAKTLERIRGRQVSQRLAEEAQKRERFKEMKQQLELDQEWRSAARRKEQDDDFSYARELRDREQRLQALEEQLERRARMDLIAQYGQLSEAAARRELRAMWKVQRMKLDERRVNFLQQEQQNVQALLEKFPLGLEVPHPETPFKQQPAQLHAEQNLSEQQTADPPVPESSAPPYSLANDVTHALISEEINIADFLPKPQRIPDSGALTQALRDIGSDLLQFPQKPHPTNSHIRLGQNVSEVLQSVPVPSQYGQASKSNFLLGQFTPEVSVGQPKASVHGHPSQSSVQLGDSTASGRNKGLIRSESNTPAQTTQEVTCEAQIGSQSTEKQPTGEKTGIEPSAASTGSEPKQATQEPTEKAKSCESVSQPSHCSQPEEEQSVSPLISFHESESDTHMRNNSRDPDPALISFLPSSDVPGHASNAHIRVGDHVSELTTPIHSAKSYGHASDAHIRVGVHVSEVTTPLLTPHMHGHASDAHIRVGEHVSDVTAAFPTPNIHGHASDAHIRVGEHVSEVTAPFPTPNIHGHASDAHIRVGEHVSEVTAPFPTPNIHGHASDAHIRVGEQVSEVTAPFPTPNIHGHASDAHIRVGEHISEVTAPFPTPNIHGHASDAHIRVGEQISEVTSPFPTPNIHGHASDTHIRVSEHISEVTAPFLTPNIHGHASDAHIRVGDHVSELTTPLLTPNMHGHASDAHIRVSEHVSDVTTSFPTPNIHGHASDAHIRVGEHVSEVTTSLPTPNIHGHASDAHIRVGEHVSEVTAPFPTPNIHGHASDAHIRVGEHVSEVTAPFPTPNIHGHASDAHIRVGEHVSEVTAPFPTPNIHGHASDAHIRVGEHISEVNTHIPVANIHGHASDSHIKVGEFVSDVTSSRPLLSKFGHSSDSTLKVGCVMPDAAPSSTPLPGSAFGHASDSVLTLGCVVSGIDPQRSPLPGSEYGHSSQSTLGIGCVVSGIETIRPSSLYSGARAHTSDSALGMGCVVGGVVPGSLYGDRLPTIFDRASEDTEKPADTDTQAPPSELFSLDEGLTAWALGLGLSPKKSPEDRYLLSLASQYQVEQYQDSYGLMTASPESELLLQVTRGPNGLPVDPSLHRATDATAVQLSEMMPLPVLMKHSVTTPLITHVSMVNKAVVDYFFVELGVEKHFETLRHFLLMEDGEFALSLSDQLFEKLGSGQTPGELLTPLVLNSILNKALQYSVHGDSELAAHFTFALRYLPEIFHPHAPDSLNCLELRYKVDWPVNIVITDSCLNKYNRLFSFLLQLKHMVWSLRDVWFHLKRTALVKGAGRSVQFHQLQLYRHEMQHFVKVIQGYIANQILQVSWSEFTHKLSSAHDLDAIHRTHAEYLNRAIFRGLLTEKAAPVMNIIHSIFSLILKFRGQLIAQPWELQQGEPVHPSFIAMQQSYNTFKYYSRFLFKVVTKLVDKGYQPHLEDFLLRINLNNYYKDS
ncbi:gamma-tubulin complex component 6 isoform X1 [Megalobrama amblycephala]|uniref:gamma-tubulin complex component 6 isoform X1 n=1 Tax=Megalobrama amblycephala TaxID=75352 RepID=UPI002014216B|nr:gamma-tubulin complex component 6 isoform X1 [Megalobrama amblycephala]XP_048015469.1 gamma-tubulin complex component 6 isoform X1 [Megalobrama amblycephala]XP_048015470.1 gamma-tubulin complex component 6 isoform X1 [Megalobrama amblycephala]